MGGGGREKTAKHGTAFYRQQFGFRDPLQVVVDASFLEAAVAQRTNVAERLQRLFRTAAVKLMTTDCIRAALRAADREKTLGLALAAKPYEVIRVCRHAPSLCPADCIAAVVQAAGLKFFVATNDAALTARLRRLPGVPIVYSKNGQVMLEPPSNASLAVCRRQEAAKLQVPAREKAQLAARMPLPEGPDTPAAQKKKRRSREPNPLSCKKKKHK